MIREPESFEQWKLSEVCDECGRGPDQDEAEVGYARYRHSVYRHNLWHATATPEDREVHEWFERQQASFARVITDSLLDELRPARTMAEMIDDFSRTDDAPAEITVEDFRAAVDALEERDRGLR